MLEQSHDIGTCGAALRPLLEAIEGRLAQTIAIKKHEFETNVAGVEAEERHGRLAPAGVTHAPLPLFKLDAIARQLFDQREGIVLEKMQANRGVGICAAVEQGASQSWLEAAQEFHRGDRRLTAET